jgi:hypothetical protein
MTQQERNILFLIKALLFLAPLSLIMVCPGYFCPFNLFFPYITGKAIFFRLVVEIALLLMVFFLIENKQYLSKFEKKDFLFWISVIFILGIIFVNFFSIRPYLSFWGNAERSEAVWGFIHFLIWFWLLWIVFKIDPNFKKTIFYSFLITLYIISFIQIQLFLKAWFDFKAGKPADLRPSSTLGNATYVGFFGNLMLFLCLYFLKGSNKAGRFYIYIGIILSIISILFSQTRGAILGISFALFVFILYYFLSSKIKLLIKILALILVFIGVLGFYEFLKTSYALKIPGISRVAESLQNSNSYMPRLISWQIFLDAFKSKPLFGYGLENSPIAYFQHFKPEIFNYEEVIFDRPHNKYIEILVTNGIMGGLFWLLLYLGFLYFIFENEKDNYLKASLLGFFIGYLVQNFTLFDIQASYLPLFFGYALLSLKQENVKKEKINEQHILPIQTLITGLVAIGVIYNFYNFYIAYKIIDFLRNDNFSQGLEIAKNLASRKSSFLPEIALMTSRYFESNLNKVSSPQQFYDALQIYSRAFELDPYDTRIYNILQLNLIRLYNASKNNNLDTSVYEKELEELFNKYIKLYPKALDFKLQYVEYLKIKGDKDKALKYLESIDKKEAKGNFKYAFNYLFALNSLDKQKALSFLEELINIDKIHPRNQFEYLTTIRVLKENNKEDLARIFIEEYLSKFKNQQDLQELESLGIDINKYLDKNK